MKNIKDIISEGKAGTLRKLDMLTIMIAYQMWKEYKLYDNNDKGLVINNG